MLWIAGTIQANTSHRHARAAGTSTASTPKEDSPEQFFRVRAARGVSGPSEVNVRNGEAAVRWTVHPYVGSLFNFTPVAEARTDAIRVIRAAQESGMSYRTLVLSGQFDGQPLFRAIYSSSAVDSTINRINADASAMTDLFNMADSHYINPALLTERDRAP